MKLLYLPLEGFVGDQVATRAAFEELLRQNKISAYGCYSFLVKAREMQSWQGMLDDLYEFIIEFKPDLIYWELQTSGEIPEKYIKKIKVILNDVIIFQRTGDSYWSPPKNMVNLGRLIDATFITSTSLIDDFTKRGCNNVKYLPERLDTIRFGEQFTPSNHRSFDIIMIANNYNDLGIKKFPGQKTRLELVKLFSKYYGKKFGLFGSGWEGEKTWQGIVPYQDQQEVMRDSWLILGVNNWEHANYFSDRYLISISSGIPVLYKHFEGCENFFLSEKECWYFHSVDEALTLSKEILSIDNNLREEIAKKAAGKAIDNYSCTKQAVEILNVFYELKSKKNEKYFNR